MADPARLIFTDVPLVQKTGEPRCDVIVQVSRPVGVPEPGLAAVTDAVNRAG